MNKRAIILATAVVFGFVAVGARLAGLMLLDHERLLRRANSQHVQKRGTEVARGNIFDRKGRELAINIYTESLFSNPAKIMSRKTAALSISRVSGLKYSALMDIFSSKRKFLWIKRKLDMETARKIKALGIEGIGFEPEIQRFYPRGSLASHVIGLVGVDNQPLEAVELMYDETLRSTAGEVYAVRDAEGRVLSDGEEIHSRGNSLVLTIDEGLQYILEEELRAAVDKWEASQGVAIMMDPGTGEVLAMAGLPTYDPNQTQRRDPASMRNRAVTDLYEPGSTFKLILAAAAFETGILGPETELDCSGGYIKVGNTRIRDSRKHGVLKFREVIQMSSNVGGVKAGLLLGRDTLLKYATRFGFGQKTGIDLPGEAAGWIVPLQGDPDIATASLAIGYGVAATPLQVLRAYAAIANKGVLVTPHVVSEIRTPEGFLVSSFKGVDEKRAVSVSTARLLKEILVSVTDDKGTAPKARVVGNRVAGKTGTTRLIDKKTNKYSKEKYVSSFVGFVPADDPKIAMVVVIHEPKGAFYGGDVAAPVFSAVAEKALAYLNVPMDRGFEENLLMVEAR